MNAQGCSAKLARLALLLRSEQRSVFGSGVSTSDGWDVILILFIADADGRRFTVGEVVARAEGEPEATRRRIAHLSHTGVVVGDGSGHMDDVITLAPIALTDVEDMLERMWAGFGTL
ncbi:hypothetical protein [uncultured Sphingomonas sp.]|uniref:hypothetical protein n=1 Tax=uncultured Sphingomonas sp. TaxID=158754 RepID=UPI0035CA932E